MESPNILVARQILEKVNSILKGKGKPEFPTSDARAVMLVAVRENKHYSSLLVGRASPAEIFSAVLSALEGVEIIDQEFGEMMLKIWASLP